MSSSKPFAAEPPLLIFGAGGHGRVLADAALLERQWINIVVSDRKLPENQSELFPGIRLLTADAALALDPLVHIAIGNNHFRQKEAAAWGHERLVSVVHPAAVVSAFSSVGAGSFVAAGAVIGPSAKVGMGVIVNHGAVVDHDVEVGAFSHIAPNASLGGHAKLGQRVLIGSGAAVLPSVVIGDDVTVGAGSVVNINLLESGTYAGLPARKIL
jgi:sugar O-acyltransferase (sialic acid O-acetyltransferase NeuD family)